MPRLTTLAVALALAGPALATPAGKEGTRKETPAEALRKALDVGITLELNDTPLAAVVQQLGEMAKVNIVFDRSAALATGDPADLVASIKAKDMKLRSALRAVCGQNGLTFGIVGDYILVSTEDVIHYRQLRQRVSLDLDAVALPKALKDLAQRTATNLLIDPRSMKAAGDTKITLQLDDVPLETAVRLMAEMAGLKPVRMGNVLLVTTEARANVLKVDADLPAPIPAGLRDGPGGPAVIPGAVPPGANGALPPMVNPMVNPPMPAAPPGGAGPPPGAPGLGVKPLPTPRTEEKEKN